LQLRHLFGGLGLPADERRAITAAKASGVSPSTGRPAPATSTSRASVSA
jgi:hypothetical protein